MKPTTKEYTTRVERASKELIKFRDNQTRRLKLWETLQEKKLNDRIKARRDSDKEKLSNYVDKVCEKNNVNKKQLNKIIGLV